MADLESDDVELPRGIALAWGVAASPQRGPKREMSVERIVDAAVELADSDGLGAVSMAAVAARLGFTPMSLYRYVSAKDDLMLLMMESATGLPSDDILQIDGWRARLEALFRGQVQVFLAHPWALDIPITGSPVTPNSAAWMDASLAALADTPLTQEERIAVTLLITGQSRWYGTILAAYANQARASGRSPEEITAYEADLFSSLISADDFPTLRRAVDAGVFASEADPFLFGLQRTLDGIDAYITSVSAHPARSKADGWMEADGADVASDKKFREAQKAVRVAERDLRDARRAERQALREARERASRARPAS